MGAYALGARATSSPLILPVAFAISVAYAKEIYAMKWRSFYNNRALTRTNFLIFLDTLFAQELSQLYDALLLRFYTQILLFVSWD